MDFFEHQDRAKRHTLWLVFLFVCAVLCIMALVYLAVAVAVSILDGTFFYEDTQQFNPGSLFRPMLMLVAGGVVLLIVLISSGVKIASLSRGGSAVAEMLGGRLIPRETRDADERKVLNVVEEMAIASGTAVPPVYLIDDGAINAFAAGFTPDTAVIGVTRGSIQRLSRDELQGVMAHEFSHILNGDMRMNIRLMGVLAGILVIAVIGMTMMRLLFRGAAFAGASRSSGNKKGGGGQVLLVLFALGLALTAIGYIGVLFGNLIKAAVSRQREYLADAAAVQFTRHPEGIGGALMKIGGVGSKISASEATEASHMFFASGVSQFIGGAFSTHPPLPDRIQRVLPSWDGRFVEPQPTARDAAEQARHRREQQEQRKQQLVGMLGAAAAGATVAQGAAGRSGNLAERIRAAREHIGNPTPAHTARARELLDAIPQPLHDAAYEPFGCRAVVYALLLDAEEAQRDKQWADLDEHADEAVVAATRKLYPHLADLPDELAQAIRLPLLDLCLPTLAELSGEQSETFLANVERLITADEKTTLREWTLRRIVRRHMERDGRGRAGKAGRSQAIGSRRLAEAGPRDAARALLSLLAYAGAKEADAARSAFDDAAPQLGLDDATPLPPQQCKLSGFDAIMDQLAELKPLEKRRLIEACTAVVTADDRVGVTEAELLRIVADALGAPMPPLLADVPEQVEPSEA